MALSRKSTSEIPKDAITITEEQALKLQWKIIQSWENLGEVWALRHTATVGAAMASITGIYINNHYRRKLKLARYGHVSSYLPIVVIPAIFNILTHKFFVQREVILNPLKHCPVCLQFRSAAFQSLFGVIYPTLLAPLAAFMYATRHFTYKLPSITENPKEVFHFWRKISRPIMPTLGAVLATQAITMMFLTYKEIEQSIQLMTTMRKIEQKYEEDIEERKHHDF